MLNRRFCIPLYNYTVAAKKGSVVICFKFKDHFDAHHLLIGIQRLEHPELNLCPHAMQLAALVRSVMTHVRAMPPLSMDAVGSAARLALPQVGCSNLRCGSHWISGICLLTINNLWRPAIPWWGQQYPDEGSTDLLFKSNASEQMWVIYSLGEIIKHSSESIKSCAHLKAARNCVCVVLTLSTLLQHYENSFNSTHKLIYIDKVLYSSSAYLESWRYCMTTSHVKDI